MLQIPLKLNCICIKYHTTDECVSPNSQQQTHSPEPFYSYVCVFVCLLISYLGIPACFCVKWGFNLVVYIHFVVMCHFWEF